MITLLKYRPSLSFVVSFFILIFALCVGVLFTVHPVTADHFAYEDSLVENVSAAALIIASLTMIYACWTLRSQAKSLHLTLTALFLAIIFFAIGMEEVSWMQRILSIETPTVLLQHNDQEELNFHNLATGLSEKTYYLGGFILLTLLPILRDKVTRVLKKIRLGNLSALVPSAWLIAPFAVVSAFIKLEFETPFFTSIAGLTLLILVIAIAKQYKKSIGSVFILSFSLCVSVVTLLATLNIDHNLHNTRPWFPSEYRELFIALGVACYAIDVTLRIKQKN